jgi:prepilin-type N-terminal cleavage/methylation domain-containing protein
MKPVVPNQRAAQAFTLLEVMLAVTILGVVVAAVYTTWSTALTAWKRGTQVLDSFQRERVVMETLQNLTRSALYFTSVPDLYQVRGETTPGLGSTVSFVTGSDVLLPHPEATTIGLRRVALGMQRDENGVVYLGIANLPAVLGAEADEWVWHVLSADVVGFGVQYRHPQHGTWSDRWEEPHLVPAALMFTVAFRGQARGGPPLIVTRAVEWPGAEAALEALGIRMSRESTTFTVTPQEIDLSQFSVERGGAE